MLVLYGPDFSFPLSLRGAIAGHHWASEGWAKTQNLHRARLLVPSDGEKPLIIRERDQSGSCCLGLGVGSRFGCRCVRSQESPGASSPPPAATRAAR